MAIGIAKAILEIKSDAKVSVNGENIDTIIWHDDNPTNITKQQIIDKQAEIETRDAHIEPRRKAYPSFEEQLDDIYHNGIDGWKATIKVIKDANPKA